MKTAELFSILFIFLLIYSDLRRERKDVIILILIQKVNCIFITMFSEKNMTAQDSNEVKMKKDLLSHI